MSTESSPNALKSTLDEMEKVCLEVSNSFIFKRDGEVLARDNNTDEVAVTSAINTFNSLAAKAECMGGIESAVFTGKNRKATFAPVKNTYFVTISSKEGDEKSLRVITRVLIPLALKTTQPIKAAPASVEVSPEHQEIKLKQEEAAEEPKEETQKPLAETSVASVLGESSQSQQLIVENAGKFDFGGLHGNQDIAKIDSSVISRWNKLYNGKKIEEVQIEETRTGKQLRCRFKPIKDQKLEGKGIIQLSEKARQKLQTKKGALVIIKPIIQESEADA